MTAEEAGASGALVPAPWSSRAACDPTVAALHPPAALDDAPLRWRVREESGAEHGGLVRAVALPAGEACGRGGRRVHARDLVLPLALPPGYHRLDDRCGRRDAGTTLLSLRPPACYRRPRRRPAAGSGVPPCSSMACARRATGASATSPTSRTIVEQWGEPRRGHRRRQPAARAVPAQPGARQSVQPVEPAVPQRAVHRRRGGRRLRANATSCARACVAPAFQAAAAGAARRRARRLRRRRGGEAAVLELLYAHFRARHLGGAHAARARVPCVPAGGRRGAAPHALFEALQEHLHRDDPSVWGWPVWPEAYRDPDSPAVARFAAEHSTASSSTSTCSGRRTLQLGAAADASSERGLAVGLYHGSRGLGRSRRRRGLGEPGALRDWRRASARRPTTSTSNGQDWGLPPLIPRAPARRRVRAVHRDAAREHARTPGALRIDHVMGLMRLFWVPPGGTAARRCLRRATRSTICSDWSRSKATATAAS